MLKLYRNYNTFSDMFRFTQEPSSMLWRHIPLLCWRAVHSGDSSWYSFLEAASTPGHMVLSVATENVPSDTTGNRSRDRSEN